LYPPPISFDPSISVPDQEIGGFPCVIAEAWLWQKPLLATYPS